jgi:hypothetical protein
MEEIYIQIAAIISAVILMVIAIFQILLFLGFPLGEYSWGGKHKRVLPPLFRIMSLPSAILLFFMGFVFLIHTTVFSIGFSFVPTHSLVWILSDLGGDFIDSLLKSILNTVGLILIVIFGFKIVKKTLKD